MLKRGRGRPAKPAGAKYVVRIIKWPPEEWEALAAAVPEGARAQFIRAAVARALREPAAGEGEQP